MLYPNQVIKKGSALSEAVKAVKVRLNLITGSTLDVTNGNFGDSTETVVKQFQKSRNLVQDGEIGEFTWEQLFKDVATPTAVSATTLSGRAIEIAKTQLKVREKTGHNDGEAVESYLKSVGLGKGYAWCAAFVYWCFNEAAKELGIKNPLDKTAGVLDHWNKSVTEHVTTPQPGDIFIMDFGKGNGHTGIVTAVKNDIVRTIEGNTGADPTTSAEDRDGQGVFERSRKISAIKGFIRY